MALLDRGEDEHDINMASITQTRVSVSDIGAGAAVSCEVDVLVGTQPFSRHLVTGDLGLTGPQLANLQNVMDVLRTRAIAVTKTDMQIP